MQHTDHTYQGGKTPGIANRVRKTRTVRSMKRNKYLTTEIAVMWLAYAVTIVCNSAFEAVQLGGTTVASVSQEVFTWFTPAGYVFSIWLLIYVALAVWLVDYTRRTPDRRRRFGLTSVLFVASCVLNVVWLMLWHFRAIGASFAIILALWVVLAALYLHVRRRATSIIEWVPLSIYTAWITVATIANMASLITRAAGGGAPFVSGVLTIFIVVAVLAIGYVMKRGYGDMVFPLVFLWAVIGVGVHVLEVSILTAVIIFILAVFGAILTFVNLPGSRPARRSS